MPSPGPAFFRALALHALGLDVNQDALNADSQAIRVHLRSRVPTGGGHGDNKYHSQAGMTARAWNPYPFGSQ